MDLRRVTPALAAACLVAAAGPAPASAGPVMRFAERQLARTDVQVHQGRFPAFANVPRGSADTGLVYGDYYFLEGLASARLDP